MIGKNEVLLKSNDGWLYFSNPHKVLQTEHINNVRETLREVEDLVNTNDWHAAGFISYEAAPAFDRALHVLGSKDFPLLWFGLYSEPQSTPLQKAGKSPIVPDWRPGIEREVYTAAIEKIKDAIANGRTYQVNYTMRLNSDFAGDEWYFFLELVQNQNKYAAFIDTGSHVICSASPELFFKLNGSRIHSQPMKGTAQRGRTTQEDKAQMEWLQRSAKNRAENVMIVDMIRNDLGRIAEIGSVHVPELFTIEKYPTLFQMTSTVQAKTKASITEIFSALFPCASITGAPKVSTMDIISKLETTPRKIYTGSIGTIAPNRKAQFSVAIRTVLIDRVKVRAEYGIGGGVVWDSTGEGEYEEALLKSRVLTDSPQKEFSLFETLLWTPEDGYFLLERHIERIMDSAEYFGVNTEHTESSGKNIRRKLGDLVAGADSPKRVKILMNSQGEISGEAKDFQADEKVFKACLAKQPVESKDRFLFHKTTQRDVYDRSLMEGYNDVLLFNENDELTEFTVGNLVVKMDGEFFTPPIECGLLAGTFRAKLLASGEIKERVIQVSDLGKCEAVFLINSLRKWVKVEFS